MNCFKKSFSGTIEDIILIFLLIITASVFSLPIIVYYISDILFVPATVSTINSSNRSNFTEASPNCSTFSVQWNKGNDNTTLSCHAYSGSVCKDFLALWHECAVIQKEGSINLKFDINITGEKQMEHERMLNALSGFMVHFESCAQVALPFLCQYMFLLSDCSTGTSYSATRDDCLMISEGVCADVWDLGLRFDYNLPNCDKLPKANAPMLSTNLSTSINESMTDDITCRDDFVKTNLICEPRCDRFEQSPHTEILIMIGSEMTAAIIALILSIATIILFIKDYKKMFKYPSILIFFQDIDIIIISSIVILQTSNRDGLYCSSVSLLETLNNPTPFCQYGGALFHYSIINIILWWFFHVAIFFHKVMFPFQANRIEKLGQDKYILAIVIICSMLVPLPAVIIGLSLDKVQYNLQRFPASICTTSSSEMWFYSSILPIDLFVGTGVVMLIVAMWNIRKKSKFHKTPQLSTAEKKIVLVFTSVTLFSTFSLGYTSDAIAKSHIFRAALTQYFECEAFGHIPGQCDRKGFEKIYSPVVGAVAHFLMGVVSLSILNFVVKWQKLKAIGGKVLSFSKYNFSKITHSITTESSV